MWNELTVVEMVIICRWSHRQTSRHRRRKRVVSLTVDFWRKMSSNRWKRDSCPNRFLLTSVSVVRQSVLGLTMMHNTKSLWPAYFVQSVYLFATVCSSSFCWS